jgi:hypothetical protein
MLFSLTVLLYCDYEQEMLCDISGPRGRINQLFNQSIGQAHTIGIVAESMDVWRWTSP